MPICPSGDSVVLCISKAALVEHHRHIKDTETKPRDQEGQHHDMFSVVGLYYSITIYNSHTLTNIFGTGN